MTFNESNFDLGNVKSETVKHWSIDIEPETSELEEKPPTEEPQQGEQHRSG